MPQFMLDANRIVGGEAAPSPIPWQVALLSGSFQFCGATILDASTLLCAAHCTPSTSHKIRVGTTNKQSGGQVCFSYFMIRVIEMISDVNLKKVVKMNENFSDPKHCPSHLQ